MTRRKNITPRPGSTINRSEISSNPTKVDFVLYRDQRLIVDTEGKSLNKRRPAMKPIKRNGQGKEFPFTTTKLTRRLQLILSKACMCLLQGFGVEYFLSQRTKAIQNLTL